MWKIKSSEIKKMSEPFQYLFSGEFVPGVDFCILRETEAIQGNGAYGKPNGKQEGNYDLKFKELTEEARRESHLTSDSDKAPYALLNKNGGIYAAFDAATQTFIITRRDDMMEAAFKKFGGIDCTMTVPFSSGTTWPLDPQKVLALQYQRAFKEAETYRKKSIKGLSSIFITDETKDEKYQSMLAEAMQLKKQATAGLNFDPLQRAALEK